MAKSVILKPGKEKSLLQRHPWIFSGAVASFPDFVNGEVLDVYSSQNQYLATAYFHKEASLSGRVLSFSKEKVEDVVHDKIKSAIYLRKELFSGKSTNSYRLINAEGDGLPGLIVDVYDTVLVVQISTTGMDRLRSLIVKALVEALHPTTIYEKSTSSSRVKEGLGPVEQLLYGEKKEEVVITENGIHFLVPIVGGQKTGFFFDQRENRHLVQSFAKDKRVLNCFSYTGGFSLYAMQGSAKIVTSVDVSEKALQYLDKSLSLNHFPPEKHHSKQEDAFSFLRNDPLAYDLVILDPPAFAKKQGDVIQACKGYKEINQVVMKKIPSGSFLLTCSCSYFIDMGLFNKVIFQAAADSKRSVQIINYHALSSDHPISIYNPEGNYLKSLLLFIK